MSKKLRTCCVCNHKDRLPIEKALMDGETLRNICARYGPSPASLSRHGPHVARSLERATAHREETLGESLLSKLERAELALERLASVAEKTGQLPSAIVGWREFRETISMIQEYRAKLPAAPGKARIFPVHDVRDNGGMREGLFLRKDSCLPGFIEKGDTIIWVRYGDPPGNEIHVMDLLPEASDAEKKVN